MDLSRFSLPHVKWSSKGDVVFENTSQTVLFMTCVLKTCHERNKWNFFTRIQVVNKVPPLLEGDKASVAVVIVSRENGKIGREQKDWRKYYGNGNSR